MTFFGFDPRGVRDDDATLDALARRQPPAAGADDAVRLLADIGAAADACTPGLDQRGPRGFAAASPERSTRSSLGWAVAAAAAAVIAVALGTVAPPSAPRQLPLSTVPASQVAPVSLSHARALVAEAEGLLGQGGPLVTPAVQDRARGLLTEARAELDRARSAQEGLPAERDEVARSLARAEATLSESARGLEGRDEETSGPTPTPSGSDEDEQHSETDNESSTGDASDEGTAPPGPEETSSHD